jgi:probable HAF family extracellular repeat protein
MKVRICVSIAISILMFSSYCFSAASFQELGNVESGLLIVPYAISDDGSTVVGYGKASQYQVAFRRTSIGTEFLVSSNINSYASGVSADGTVVVGGILGISSNYAFRWTTGIGIETLGDLPGGKVDSVANGVSADGSIVVGSSTSLNGREAFRFSDSSGMVGLGDLPAGIFFSGATKISADGSVIVGHSSISNSSGPAQAFRWTQTTGMLGLGYLAGYSSSYHSYANDLSADGSVIVGESTSSNGREAFRWTPSTGMVGLGDFAGGPFSSIATATSADGSVVVGTGMVDSGNVAFYWTAETGLLSLQDMLLSYGLNLDGWELTKCIDISGDGKTIVGEGYNPQGYRDGWIATIPEPTTILLLGLGGMVLRKFKI